MRSTLPRRRRPPWRDLVYDKSGGNPFFTIQFLTALAEEKLLTFSPGAGRWVWDLKRIRAKGYTDNVADLMVAKLARLPPQTQESLQWLAALGDRAETAVLALVLERPAEAIHAALREAVQAGLVLMQDEVYAFMHDRVREAAYSQIPEASRAERHLRIGRSLLSGLPPAEIAERIFEVVAQLNRGLALVEAPQERDRIAELNLRAGERAKASAAYAAALTYFAAGAELLGAGPLDAPLRSGLRPGAQSGGVRIPDRRHGGGGPTAGDALGPGRRHRGSGRRHLPAPRALYGDEPFRPRRRGGPRISAAGRHRLVAPSHRGRRQDQNTTRCGAARRTPDRIPHRSAADERSRTARDARCSGLVGGPGFFHRPEPFGPGRRARGESQSRIRQRRLFSSAYASVGIVLGSYFGDYESAFRFGSLR